jgi:hypothetical protein
MVIYPDFILGEAVDLCANKRQGASLENYQ